MPAAFTLTLVLVAATVGCGTTYQPRPGRRISQVIGNDTDYVRDGQRFKLGAFGGNAEALVGGNDLAVQYARKYRHRLIAGEAFLVVSYAALLTGAIVFIPRESGNPAYVGAGLGTLFGGLATGITGAVLFSRARGALLDAINIYNDGLDGPVDPRFSAPPPPPFGR